MRRARTFVTLLALFISIPLYSQENIELNINGKLFTREYPASLPEATELIDNLVRMYNDLNSSFIDYRGIVGKGEEELKSGIAILEQNNLKIKNELEAVQNDVKIMETYIKKEISRPKDWMLLGSLGPAMNINERLFGLNVELGFMRNLHLLNSFAGLNINTSMYYETTTFRINSVGLSLYFGIFLD
jgi:hypothetical protein